MVIFLLLFGAWIAIGIALALWLGHRGHDASTWLLLGALLGPLAILFALDSIRHDEQIQPEAVRVGHDDQAVDGLNVLVGYDASPEAQAAVAEALALFEGRLHRLTLAYVIPYDGGLADERTARAALDQGAGLVTGILPTLEIVRGRRADALVELAAAGGFDVLIVGTKESGRAHVLGSTAQELARQTRVPVLLNGTTPLHPVR